MTRLSRFPPRDLESLSAYADGRLSPAERQALEARLGRETELRAALDQIRTTASLLRALPSVRPPRSFVLTPEMAGVRRRGLGYPALQLATAMATLGFIVTLGVDLFSFSAAPSAMRAAAPMEETVLEAPAAQALPLNDAAGAGAPEAGAAMEAASTPELGAEAQMDALQATLPPAPTATAPAAPTESAYRAAPALEAGSLTAVPTAEGAAPPPSAESGVTTEPGCEACGGEQLLPPGTQSEKTAGELATPAEATIESAAALAAEGEAATSEAFALQAPPPLEPAPEIPPAGLPWLRWVEIALAATAIMLAGLTFRARTKSR
jgi:hypothetical protein